MAVTVQASTGDALGVLMLELAGLDGYWRHSDVPGTHVLLDSSGQGHDGTMAGTPTFGVSPELDDPANLGRAIAYGGGASAEIPLAVLPASGTAAYSCRFKPVQADIDNQAAILSRNRAGNLAGNWVARITSDGGFRVFIQEGDPTPQTDLEAPAGTVVAGRWYHIWVLMGPGGVQLWINSKLIDSDSRHTIGETGADMPLQIAASSFTPNFQGTIHEVARTTTLPTPQQIADRSFFTAAGDGDEDRPLVDPGDVLGVLMLKLAGLDGYWRHSDVPGTHVLLDSSGQGHDGTMAGTPAFGVSPELDDPTNLGRAVAYGGGASAAVPLAVLPASGTAAYSCRFKPVQADIDNQAAILSRNRAGNLAGNWVARITSDGGFRVFIQEGDPTPQTDLEAPAGTVVAGRWYHIWVLMGPGGVQLWINSKLIDSDSRHTIGETGADMPLQIAASSFTPNFQGTIHEVARTTTLPTPQQIADRSFFTAAGDGFRAAGSGDEDGPLAETNLPEGANPKTVTRNDNLSAALGDATVDEIVLADGSYRGFTVDRSGTDAKPLIIRAQNMLGAKITSGTISVDASNVILYGLDCVSNGALRIGKNAASKDVRVWRCRWRDKTSGSSQAVRTFDAERTDLAFCEWTNWKGTGLLLGVTDGTRETTVRYCLFRDTPAGWSQVGAEAIRTGFGSRDIESGILIYRCKVRNWNGDSNKEMLKLSHSSNIVRQVTVENCDGHLANRGGQNNRYEGCIVRDCRGLGIQDGFLPDRVNKVLRCLVEGKKPGKSQPCEIIIRGGNVEPGVKKNGTHNLAEGTVVLGCTGPIDVGHLYSEHSKKARFTRIRGHSGKINLDSAGQEDTDIQPLVDERLSKLSAPLELADNAVGPNAGL